MSERGGREGGRRERERGCVCVKGEGEKDERKERKSSVRKLN